MGNLHLINKRRRHQERVFPAWPQLWGSCLTMVIPVCYKAGQGLVVLSKQTVRVTASESARSSALSVRMEQILLLLHYSSSDFYFGGILAKFHRQMFQPGLEHPRYQERKSSAGLLFL